MTRKSRQPKKTSVPQNRDIVKEEIKPDMAQTNNTNEDLNEMAPSHQITQTNDTSHIKIIKTAAPKKSTKETIAVIKPILEPIFIFMD